MDQADYSVGFYYSTTDFGASSTDLDSNLGTELRTGYSSFGNLNDGVMFGAYTHNFGADPSDGFIYDPTLGDLIMQVELVAVELLIGSYQSFFKADYTGTEVLPNYSNCSGTTANATGALQITLEMYDVVPVPLPASALMLGTVVAGLGLAGRRRQI